MRQILLFALPTAIGILCNIVSFAQGQFSHTTRDFITELTPYLDARSGQLRGDCNDLLQRYGVYAQDGKYYAGFAVLVEAGFDGAGLKQKGVIMSSRIGNVLSMKVPVQHIQGLADYPGIKYIDMGDQVSPSLDKARQATRVDSVQKALGGVKLPYTGKGVIVAVIDWGFNYSHPVFFDSSGNNLRISRAWDQNKLSGPAPQGYSYGAEYASQQALLAAEQDTIYNINTRSHGTHVAGIAAGSGGGTVYKGMAPDAEIIMVSLRRDAGSFIDAINYIHNYAAQVQKPYVVNMSFGGYTGANDGKALESIAMDTLSKKGGIFVSAAGNNGAVNFHLGHKFQPGTDTVKTVVNFQSGVDNYFGENLSMWGSPNTSFTIKLRLANSFNQFVYETSYFSSATNPSFRDTVILNTKDTFIVYVTGTAANVLNNKPNISVTVRNKTPYKLVLYLTSQNSEVHVWNIIQLFARTWNVGVGLASNYTGAVAGDAGYGVCGYAGTTLSVITTAAYRPDYLDSSSNLLQGQLASFSSKGPAIDILSMKPEIAGPGQDIMSAVNINDQDAGTILATIPRDTLQYPLAKYSGTSMASPCVAGIVALMLQANPSLPAYRAKQILIATARLDQNTGSIPQTGDISWGWGKANALAALLMTEATVSAPSISFVPDVPQVYPNPSTGRVTVNTGDIRFSTLRCYDMNGRVVMERKLEQASSGFELDMENWPKGVYLLYLDNGKQAAVTRLVHE